MDWLICALIIAIPFVIFIEQRRQRLLDNYEKFVQSDKYEDIMQCIDDTTPTQSQLDAEKTERERN